MDQTAKEVLKYLLWAYPNKGQLSASRLIKLLYLIDWKSALENDRQITETKWYFNHYGPYVDSILEEAGEDDDIEITNECNVYGGKKKLVQLSLKCTNPVELDAQKKSLADFVINATKSKTYEEFIKLVYSTYPVLTGSRYTNLDLVSAAKAYKEVKKRAVQHAHNKIV